MVRHWLRGLISLSPSFTLHPARTDLLWARQIQNHARQLPSPHERLLSYRSVEAIVEDDAPRTRLLKNALRGKEIAALAEQRGKTAADPVEKRVLAAGSIQELWRMWWRISLARVRLVAASMLEDDMKARWTPFGGRFLDYLGRGGVGFRCEPAGFGLVVGVDQQRQHRGRFGR